MIMTVTVMANNDSNDKNCKTDNKYITGTVDTHSIMWSKL